ncbi:hypothetical protein ACFE04_021280 [Oxalis oulophora]
MNIREEGIVDKVQDITSKVCGSNNKVIVLVIKDRLIGRLRRVRVSISLVLAIVRIKVLSFHVVRLGRGSTRGGFWAKGGAQLLGKGRGTASGQREGHELLSIAVAGASITTSPIEDGTRLLICTRRVRPTRSSRRSSRRRNNNTNNSVVGRGWAGCSWSKWEELERRRVVGIGTSLVVTGQ